jgi:hypothetical protein
VNHCLDEGLVHRKNRHEWNSTCRIALCESTRFIVGQYVPKLQRDCASFWQWNNRKFRVVSKAKIDRLREIEEQSPSIVPLMRNGNL